MTIKKARKFIDNVEWVWAKSYQDTYPHYYTTRELVNDDKLFEEFLWYMRDKGIAKNFWSRQHIYCEIDGYEYWEMGRPIPSVQVINKAIINDSQKYRGRLVTPEMEAKLKDTLYNRELYLAKLLNKKIPTRKDLKQIEFLMDNKRRINGGGKNIIDNYKQTIRYE